jgi:hypothetical protein
MGGRIEIAYLLPIACCVNGSEMREPYPIGTKIIRRRPIIPSLRPTGGLEGAPGAVKGVVRG